MGGVADRIRWVGGASGEWVEEEEAGQQAHAEIYPRPGKEDAHEDYSLTAS